MQSEELDNPELTVVYEPGEDSCVVTVRPMKVTLHISPRSVRVEVRSKMSPEGLISVLEQSRAKMIELAGPSVRLLN
jgi:hypothetical protein